MPLFQSIYSSLVNTMLLKASIRSRPSIETTHLFQALYAVYITLVSSLTAVIIDLFFQLPIQFQGSSQCSSAASARRSAIIVLTSLVIIFFSAIGQQALTRVQSFFLSLYSIIIIGISLYKNKIYDEEWFITYDGQVNIERYLLSPPCTRRCKWQFLLPYEYVSEPIVTDLSDSLQMNLGLYYQLFALYE